MSEQKQDQRTELKAAANASVLAMIECDECGDTIERDYSADQAIDQSKRDLAYTAWDEGWEIHDGRVLCLDCTPDEEEIK